MCIYIYIHTHTHTHIHTYIYIACIFVHKPSHTVVRCGVWEKAVKLTYDRLWCVVSGKKPPVHRCMYVSMYRHRIEKRVQIR